MTLLSTTFLIDIMRRDAPALDMLARLERSSGAIRIPAVVYVDLWQAAGESRHAPREWDRVEALLRGYSPVALEPRHAMRAGTLAARHALSLRDALLVATAIEERDEVVVRDAGPYADIDGLRVVTY